MTSGYPFGGWDIFEQNDIGVGKTVRLNASSDTAQLFDSSTSVTGAFSDWTDPFLVGITDRHNSGTNKVTRTLYINGVEIVSQVFAATGVRGLLYSNSAANHAMQIDAGLTTASTSDESDFNIGGLFCITGVDLDATGWLEIYNRYKNS